MPTPNVRGLEPAVSTLAHNQGMNRADQDPEVAPKKFWIALHVEHGESTTSNEDQSWQPHQVLSSTQLTRAESIVFEDPVLLAGFAPCCLPNVSAHLELSMSNSAVRACERTSMCSKFALAGVHASLERSRTWTRGAQSCPRYVRHSESSPHLRSGSSPPRPSRGAETGLGVGTPL
ncbi:hypothetical protein OH76DRAFT_1490918 [Lentinus brumalis]|uniref:Uncharacterized protein n=1 Tax=Lentinus brumalis TaxID=2498619 RepID=A0A371CHB4_9APHY|nr:hypothetical protein OH76DRAFT_1490918 [Polyporus brumalis]